jgi:thiol:disulfide interchange protein DsbD
MKYRIPEILRLAILSLILLIPAAAAQAAIGRGGEADILKPEQAFRYVASATADEILVRWTIEPEHYLYRERMSYESRTSGITLGTASIPTGIPHSDEYFGQMHIFRDELEVRLPITTRPAGPVKLALAIKSQGCADIGLCYPPQVWVSNVELPAGGSSAASPGKLSALLIGTRRDGSDEPLPVALAFPLDTVLADDFTLQIRWDTTPGYYLYRHTLNASTSSDSVQFGPPSLPAGTPMNDETYGDTLVFQEPVTMTVPLIRRGPAAVNLPLTIEYQGCKQDSICYPPQRLSITLDLPAVQTDASGAAAQPAAAEQDRLYTLIRDGNLLAVMAMFAGLGLLLSFTPCCLPMYPILSGIIVGQSGRSDESDGAQKSGTARSFLLSVAFVLGMAVTYTALGAVFAAAGSQVQAVMQKPWVTIGVTLLFVALALSMFGLFELQIPSSWQTRLNAMSGRQQSGRLLGAGIMGMISAAVVTTCVTPPLVAALTVIARTGDLSRGALALFALAIGMGIPLLAIGASAGHLMPKTGAWMNSVKAIFGLMMLGLGVWMMDRLWSATVTLALWGVLLVTASILLGTFDALGEKATLARKGAKALGIVALLYGSVLLLGAFTGSKDATQPLQFLRGTTSGITAGIDRKSESSPFIRIKTNADLDAQLARAVAAGQPVMLDFYADWCVSCKELEKYTFPDPAVRKRLARAVTLQADVTAMDASDQALMKRFGIIGPPTIVFFSAAGTEQPGFRVVGFMKAEAFAAHLRNAFAPPAGD